MAGLKKRLVYSAWVLSARSVLDIFALRACDQPEDRDIEALLERVTELEHELAELKATGVRVAAAPVENSGQMQKKPAAPKPAPIPDTPVPDGSKAPKDVWNDMLKQLKKTEPSIYGPLSRAKYGGYQDGVYKALFMPGEEIFQTMLSGEKHKTKIEAALNQCGGLDAKFEAASQIPQADPGADKRREQNMASLIDTFGRDKVQIDEEFLSERSVS